MKIFKQNNFEINRIIPVSISVLFLTFISILIFTYASNDIRKFKSHINKHEYTKAKILFDTKLSDNSEDIKNAKSYIGKRMVVILEDYKNNKVDIYNSIELIKILGSFDLTDTSFELIETIKAIEAESTCSRYYKTEITAIYSIEHIISFLDNDNQINQNKYIVDIIDNETKIIYTNFNNGLTNYNKTMEALLDIKNVVTTETILEVISDVDNLNDSKELYKLGAEYYKNNEYIKALKSLRLVIENDNNYEAAKELELLLNDIVKDYISDEIITLCGNYEYEKAIKYANTGIELFPEDTQFVTKKEILEVEREEYYRTNQRLEIIYHNITSDWLHKILLEVIVFNNTNKVVREFTIGYMGYDKNGYPVKSGFLVNEFLVVGQATAANIQPMEKYGEGTVWDVYNTDVSKIKVCVKTVSYYDDSKWDNPYYDIWIDKYLNKPIK